MSSELVAVLFSAALVACVSAALIAKKVSVSLIALFYAALVLGLTFTFYGDALIGLLTMVTFAGAVSVLLLTVILITGESSLPLGRLAPATLLVPAAAAVGVASIVVLFPAQAGNLAASDSSLAVVGFAWTLRPWDLLILMVVFAAAMLSVVNLFGGEK